MTEDPIVEEVRRHRRARAAMFNYDIEAIAEDARKRERAGRHKVIGPPQRQADPPGAETAPAPRRQ
jgi:hypothetical protein